MQPNLKSSASSADIDILAHPGLITAEEAGLAATRGIHLEITTRKGHSLTNGHVAKMARQYKAKLVLDNDAVANATDARECAAQFVVGKAVAGEGADDAEGHLLIGQAVEVAEVFASLERAEEERLARVQALEIEGEGEAEGVEE